MPPNELSNEELKNLIAATAMTAKDVLKIAESNTKAIEALGQKIDSYVSSTNKSLQDLMNVVLQLHTRVEEVSPAKTGGRSATEEVFPQAAKGCS